MKTLALRGMFAAAALMVAAGVASAQTYKAEVPMAFRAGETAMAPGTYEIKTSAAESYRVTLYNRADSKSVMLLGGIQSDPPASWLSGGAPKVTFECLDGNCRLKSIFHGAGSMQTFSTPRSGNLTAHRPELVTLTMIKVR